ncbi:MAG: BatD family protein [Thiotrichales bacterium]|nr:BatD family protein [Thiotrichales bacterium]
MVKMKAHLPQRITWLLTLWITLLFGWNGTAYAERLTMSIERELIEQGDLISLWVEADFDTLGKTLDATNLEKEFDVVSKQRSNFYEFTNGIYSAKTRWHLRLMPKKTGVIVIPPVTLGKVEAQALIIEVKPSNQTQNQAEKTVFLRAEVDQQEGFVQQQFLYRLRFYYRGQLLPTTGDMNAPLFSNAFAEALKEEQMYSTVIDGKDYTVHEWIYVLFPQSSGELTIPPARVRGVVSFDGRQKAIDEKSEPVVLNIRPPVSDQQAYSAAQPWLPAQSLLLEEQWQSPPETLRVGDSLTRTLTLQAYGLKANQLPKIEMANGEGFKVYSLPPTREEEKFASGIVSRVQVQQNIVPTAKGELTVPAYQLRWFNTLTQQFETLHLDAQTFVVQAALANATYSNPTPPELIESVEPPSAQSHLDWLIWPLVTTFFAIAWVITLVMWWLARSQKKGEPRPDEIPEVTPAFTQAQWCQAEDRIFYPQLRQYLLNSWQVRELAQLEALNGAALAEKIHRFEQAFYAPHQENHQENLELKQQICQALSQLKKPKTPKKLGIKGTPLQSLYPEVKTRNEP